jgi:hypothetical protein
MPEFQITSIGPNGIEDATFHIHAKGCRDIAGRKYRRSEKHDMTVTSVQQMAELDFADQIAECYEADDPYSTWEAYAGEYKVFPCANLPWAEGEVVTEVKVEAKVEAKSGNTWSKVEGLGPRQREVMEALAEQGLWNHRKIGKMDRVWTIEVLDSLVKKGLVAKVFDHKTASWTFSVQQEAEAVAS